MAENQLKVNLVRNTVRRKDYDVMGREIHAVGSSGIQRIRVGSWDAGMETGDAWVGE